MIDPESQARLKDEIEKRMSSDRAILDELRAEIRPLKALTKKIQPRTTTALSLVGTDGGNNKIKFDPFLIQIVRVVDSSNNEYSLEVISPTTSVDELAKSHFNDSGDPITPLGEMMRFLGVTRLTAVSHMIRNNEGGKPTSATWTQVYRELVEWATLFSIIKNKSFGTDTLFVFDGLLRSKVFAKDLFKKLREGISDAIDKQWKDSRRRIYLAGVAKHSQVLTRYRLAMALENVLVTDYPAYAEVPRDIETKAYVWSEYARGDDNMPTDEGEVNKFVGGSMFLVKFGAGTRDPIWPVDIFTPQVGDAQAILGFMLADAINGFPVPHYPQCLQKAHENAALVDFDFDVMNDMARRGLRNALGDDGPKLDPFELQDADPAHSRY
ncbi:MAG: hypothetical protein KIT61_01555 [Pyrinomonadaceae bacterium]|nr:hypothetical protein [Pyrinomonadaceae bacterium]